MQLTRLCLLLMSMLSLYSLMAAAPVAYVYEVKDQWTKTTGAKERLTEAGFEVRDLPLDRSPFQLLDSHLIVFGSCVADHPGYKLYMKRYAKALYHYVDKGNTILQMTQPDQNEASPAFLPSTHGARRSDRDFKTVSALNPANPLLKGIRFKKNRLQLDATRTAWESFVDFSGFEVILYGGDEDRMSPCLMEGAYGQGRMILAAMGFDKKYKKTDRFTVASDAFAAQFFANLKQHVINVKKRQTRPLQITFNAVGLSQRSEGSWTLALLPDTQVYSLRYPGMFTMQTSWLAQNVDVLNLKYVFHLGDIVNNNTRKEWKRAQAAMRLLDGKVPYMMATGNHDYGPSGDASNRETYFNEYFPFSTAEAMATFGGAKEKAKLDNTFHLFEVHGQKWIALSLEWAPTADTVAWANRVMDAHPDRLGMLVTHAYMNNNDRRYDHADSQYPQDYNPHEYRTPGEKYDGEELWHKLVKKHRFVMTFNGHVLGDGTGYLLSTTDKGTRCHQMLSNFQMRKLGCEGYMRLLEFQPDGKTIVVKTYTPLYDKYLRSEDQSFQIELGPGVGAKK